MRRLLVLASTVIFFDVAFYSAIAPLLPSYVDVLGLSKAQAGILTASYAAGALLAALPAGYLASRFGPRRTTIAGLLLLGGASLVFGLVHQVLLLDAARLAQGMAGALIWSGAMAWLVLVAPEEKRGSVIGTALGTAVAGALFGPALGAAAATVGTGVIFGSVLLFALVLAGAAASLEDARTEEGQTLVEVGRTMLSRPLVDAMIFITVPSLMFGAIEVLVPLRIDSLGGGHTVIAAGFIAGAGLEAMLAPVAGRIADRVGPRPPYVLGLSICAVAMVGIALAEALGVVLAFLVMTSVGAGLCFAPAVTLISDIADASGLHQGYAAGLGNMAWAAGQMLGGIGGGGIASITGDTAPSVAIAAGMGLTVLYALRSLRPVAATAALEG